MEAANVGILNHRKFPIYVCLALSLILAVLMLTRVGESLRVMSIDLIKDAKNHYTNKSADFYLDLFSQGADEYIIEIILLSSYVFLTQKSMMTLTLIYAMISSFVPIIKISLRFSKPWFYDETFQPTDEDYEYGMASGHTLKAVGFYLSLAHFLLKDYKIHLRIVKVVIYFLVIYLSFNFGYTRVLMGQQTLDQVLFGFSIGAFFHIIFCYVLEDHFKNLWTEIIVNPYSLINNSAVYIMILQNAIAVGALYHHEHTFKIEPEWKSITHSQGELIK